MAYVAGASYDPISHAQLVCPDTSTVQTATAPATAIACVVTAKTSAVRATFDRSTPAAGNGLVIASGTAPIVLPCADQIKAIGDTAAANLDILWLG